MLNVAILGSGKQLLQQYKTWSNITNASVVGIVDVSGEDNVPQDHMKDIQTDSLEELSQLDVNLVDVCVPLNEKAAYIKQAANLGMNVTSDVPVAAAVEEAVSVLNTCEQNNVRFYPRGTLRFSPPYADAHAQVSKGAIGRPGVMRMSRGGPHPGDESDIFMVLGLVELDWLIWNFGEVDHVFAKHVKKKSVSGEFVEYAALALRMADHSMAHLELSWAQTHPSDAFELTGDKGMLSHDSESSQPIKVDVLEPFTLEKPSDEILAKSISEHELAHFSRCLLDGTQPLVTLENVLNAMKVAAAAKESAATGKSVDMKRGVSK